MLMIQDVDLTPNPHALKFILNEQLLAAETRQYSKKEDAADDPLALGIFNIDGVVSVFYMNNFISIEKRKDAGWGQIQKPFIEFLNSFDKSLIPEEKEVKGPENAGELLNRINQLLDTRVRPALTGDDDGLEVLGIEGNLVKIRYQGACGSCPSSISVTLNAIEGLLKRDINPMLEVVPA